MGEKVLCNKEDLVIIAETMRTITNSEKTYTVSELAGTVVETSGCVTVTFMDGNEILFTRPVYVGDDCPDPVAQGRIDTPTKEETVNYTYTFSGWSTANGGIADSNILEDIMVNKTLYAAFVQNVRLYTITYYDEDGKTILNTERLPYGSTPSYVPTKAGFGFAGWTTPIISVTENTSYTVSSWIACVSSGVCGDNANWILGEDYTLTIFGTGEVTNGTWFDLTNDIDYRSTVKALVVEEGITGLSGQSGGSILGVPLFYSHSGLTSVTLPSTLTHISDGCFGMCKNIAKVYIPSMDWWWHLSLSHVDDTPVRSNGSVFVNGEAFTGELIVPTWIHEIPNSQFYGWKGITSVTLHPGVTSIGSYSFCATGITSFVVPDYVTSIGSCAFQACYSLTSIDFGNITVIPSSACSSCNKLTNIAFSENITEIKSYAFSGTTNLKINLVIPASVTKFGVSMIASSGVTGVTFEDAEGWTATKYVGSGPDTVSFTASELADPAINARNLKSTSYYQYYNWEKF